MMESESLWKSLEDMNPLKRNGLSTDMAGTALYLCSRAGSFTNGVTIVLDGGKTLHDSGIGIRQAANL